MTTLLICTAPDNYMLLAAVHSVVALPKMLQAADMVMHPSPGHYSGTLVNALLHHCQLPAMQLALGAASPVSLEGAAAAAAVAAAATEEAAGRSNTTINWPGKAREKSHELRMIRIHLAFERMLLLRHPELKILQM